MPWREHLQRLLREAHPASVCALDDAALELAARALPDVPLHRYPDLPATRCTLALGVDALDGLDRQQAEQLISRIRTYSAPRVLLAARPDCPLDEAGFRALGFVLTLADPAENVRIHDYDIETYKSVPDWLNSRFWANPERWEP